MLKALKSELPDGKYPFAHNWRGEGVTRWLSWLFEADGRLLAEKLSDPAIDSLPGRAALDYTKNLFAQSYVSPKNAIKSSRASDSFRPQTVTMISSGASAIPDYEQNLGFEWGPPSPRKTSVAPAISAATLWSLPRQRGTPNSPRRFWTS